MSRQPLTPEQAAEELHRELARDEVVDLLREARCLGLLRKGVLPQDAAREELVSQLREAECLELLREYARLTGDRRDAPAVLRTALTEAVGAVLALRAEMNRRPLGRAPESWPDMKQARGTSGAKGPDVVPTVRRHGASRAIARGVEGRRAKGIPAAAGSLDSSL